MRAFMPWLLAGLMSVTGAAAAADAAPGTELWSYATAGQVWSAPAVAEGTLYVGSDDHRLHAVDLATHAARWTYYTGGAVRSRPLVAGDLVLVESDDGYLHAVDRRTGQRQWRADLKSRDLVRRGPTLDNPYYDWRASSPVATADGLVVVGSAAARISAFKLATGEPAWSSGVEDMVRGDPLVVGTRIVFGSWDHHVYAVDARTGKLAWRFDTGNIVQSAPALGQGTVVIGSRSAKVFGLDAATGALRWTHPHADGSWVESSAVFADGRFVVGSSDALKLQALDPATGRELWAYRTGGWSWSTPAVANGVAYVGSLSGSPYYMPGVTLQGALHAVDAATGRLLWRFTPGPSIVPGYITGGVAAAPAVVDGVVYVGAMDGKVHALKAG